MSESSHPGGVIDAAVGPTPARQYPAELLALAREWPRVSAIDGAALRSIVEALPDADWQTDARIVASVGASYRSLGSPSRSAALLYFTAAETLIATGIAPSVDLPAIQLHHSAILRSLGMLDSALNKAESASALLQQEGGLPFSVRVSLQAVAAVQLGLIKLHLGDYRAATTHLRLASGLSERGLSAADSVECQAGLSVAAYATGDYRRAETHIARAKALAGDTGLLHSGFGAAALATEILISVDRNEQSRSQSLSSRLSAIAHLGDWEPLALYAKAASAAINGQLIQALDLQRRCIAAARSWEGTPIIRTMGEVLRGGLHLHLGETAAATEVLAAVAPTHDHIDCPGRLLAGILFATGDFAGCLGALAPCRALGDSHSTRTLLDVLLLSAAANHELGSLIASDVAFDRALYFGSQTGILLPFLVIPRVAMLRMLDRASDRYQPETVQRLLAELRVGSGTPPEALEALSERELDIVQHLAQEKTIGQIAAELYISTNTVKTHVRSIYRKLSATSRKEAIRRVRELGLELKITRF